MLLTLLIKKKLIDEIHIYLVLPLRLSGLVSQSKILLKDEVPASDSNSERWL